MLINKVQKKFRVGHSSNKKLKKITIPEEIPNIKINDFLTCSWKSTDNELQITYTKELKNGKEKIISKKD